MAEAKLTELLVAAHADIAKGALMALRAGITSIKHIYDGIRAFPGDEPAGIYPLSDSGGGLHPEQG